MTEPLVSFVVPCYNLGHLLPVCVESILSQTYSNTEILIMDDCSPDDTAKVAQSFNDERVMHVRNDPNLGHLRNFNKGISLSRGKYIWLISADDYLRTGNVLQRYVDAMERNPNVGYVFSTGYGVRDNEETRLLGRLPVQGDVDGIYSGHQLLKQLIQGNFVLTPSGMVRRDCYEKISLFPLDMPWAGDWYLWCLFAFYRDVAYFAEPMVCYREQHELSMTHQCLGDRIDESALEELRIAWSIWRKARDEGYTELARASLIGIAKTHARVMSSLRYQNAKTYLNIEVLEHWLRQAQLTASERVLVETQVFASMGDEFHWRANPELAEKYYRMALKKNPWQLSILAKRLVLRLGKPGRYLRKRASNCKVMREISREVEYD